MSHAGLLVIASPRSANGKIPDDERPNRLDDISKLGEPKGYATFFTRWEKALSALPEVRTATATATSRTLIGHGLASAHQVGLTLHHTYGVPYLPGSAVKGVTSHFAHEVLGRDEAKWRGPELVEGRVTKEPGAYFRALFGASPSDGDRLGFEGQVEFHDALPLVGKSCLKPDVLTPHQTTYYASGSEDPNDYTSPVPVGFVTAAPGVAYKVFLSGPAAWTEIAMKLVVAALAERGIGGKTSSGYGRFRLDVDKTAEDLRKEEKAWATTGLQSALARVEGPQHLGQLTEPLGGAAALLSATEIADILVASTSKDLRERLLEWLAKREMGDLVAAFRLASAPKLAAPRPIAPAPAPAPPAEEWMSATLWKAKPDAKDFPVVFRIDGDTFESKSHTIETHDGKKLRSKEGWALTVPDGESNAIAVQVLRDGKKIKKVRLP